jgi:hypothetical protein
MYLLPALAVAFVVASGWRRGAVLTGVTAVVVLLTIAPWTIRTYYVTDAFVPLSVQDITPYGTFNDEAAGDPRYPYAWRVHNSRDEPILRNARELGDLEVRRRLKHNTSEYIKEHPTSVVKAFFWNGITRLWDLRRPGHVVGESPAQGRSRAVTAVGLAIYWVLLPLAIAALWIHRRRRALVLPIVALVVSASVVFTAEAATRYRAPFEPLVAVLACAAAVPVIDRARERPRGARALAEPV